MSFNYAKVAASATKLLQKFGRAIVRREIAEGVYHPEGAIPPWGEMRAGIDAWGSFVPGGIIIGDIETDSPRVAAVFDFTDQGRQGERYVRGSLVIVGDKQMLLDPNGPAAMTDRYFVGSDEYSVVSVGEVNPAGTNVLFDLHLRKA